MDKERESAMSEVNYEENMALAVAIRKMNGTIIYQHLTDGTNHDNQNWRKYL